jgi:hypothetical protein
MNRMVLAATMSLLVLSACGTSTQDRAISGGAMGAAAGGVGGLLLDHPVAGALRRRAPTMPRERRRRRPTNRPRR